MSRWSRQHCWHCAALLAALMISFACAPALSAAPIVDFTGPYDPANWTTAAPAGGSIDTSGAPSTIVLLGPDSESDGNLDFFILVPASGVISFDWSYSSIDSDDWDQAFYFVNGIPVFLAQNDSQGTGSESVSVLAGDTFGFRVFSRDGAFGPGVLTISNFSADDAGAIPEPSTMLLMVAGLAVVFGARRRQRRMAIGS